MRPSQALKSNISKIREVVERYHGKKPRIFGSVLRGEDTECSDLDILIDPTDKMTLFDIGAMRAELKELLEVEVDISTPSSLSSRWRAKVIKEAKPI